MRRIRGQVVAGIVLVLMVGTARAGGFTQPAGGLYIKVWDRTLAGSGGLTADGDRVDLGDIYQDHALNYYLEYGVTSQWTFVTMGRPVGWASLAGESTVYVGDLRVGVRRAIVQTGPHLSAEVHYGYAPDVGTGALGAGVAEGHPFIYAATVETHSVDGELQLGVSPSWGWITATVGFRWLSAEGLDPVVYANAGVGHQFECGLSLNGYVASHQPLGAVELTNVSGAGQTRFVGYGLDVSYWFVPTASIYLGVGGAVPAVTQSNAATPALQLGFELRR